LSNSDFAQYNGPQRRLVKSRLAPFTKIQSIY
jgi:hypothetical protein